MVQLWGDGRQSRAEPQSFFGASQRPAYTGQQPSRGHDGYSNQTIQAQQREPQPFFGGRQWMRQPVQATTGPNVQQPQAQTLAQPQTQPQQTSTNAPPPASPPPPAANPQAFMAEMMAQRNAQPQAEPVGTVDPGFATLRSNATPGLANGVYAYNPFGNAPRVSAVVAALNGLR